MIDVVQQSLFDYASLDADTRVFVQEITEETHALVRQTDDNIVRIGKNLQAVKDRLPHGQFLPWLAAEFDWTVQTAANFMNYARLADKNKRLLNLPREVGYVLGQKSMPDVVVEKVLNEEIPATIEAVREAKQEAQATNTGHGISELYSRSQGNPTLYTIPVDEGSRTVRTPVEMDRGLSYADKEAHPILNTLTSKSNEWYTPQKYVDAAREVMGGIDTDPASNALANEKVRARNFYDIQTNGLDKDWTGRVWLNPPYGRDEAGSNQDIWSKRLIEQYEAGITTEAILLVNAAVDTKWFQRLFQYPVCFPDHRINFYSSESSVSGSTHGSALIYFGSHSDRFFEIFSEFGTVVRRW